MRQRSIAALILAWLSLFALFGGAATADLNRGIYLVVFSLLVAAAACWLSATAVRRARLAATMRPRGAILGLIIGCIGVALSVITLIALAVFWQQFDTYSKCRASAQTVTAQQACQNALTRSINERISQIGAGG